MFSPTKLQELFKCQNSKNKKDIGNFKVGPEVGVFKRTNTLANY